MDWQVGERDPQMTERLWGFMVKRSAQKALGCTAYITPQNWPIQKALGSTAYITPQNCLKF